MARQARETPFAVTMPVFIAVTALATLGVAAVLGSAAVRAHREPTFHPDWAVWAPVSIRIVQRDRGSVGRWRRTWRRSS